MKYTICTSYNWYQTDIEKFIIKTYYINGVAFTFDEIPNSLQDNPDIIQEANNNPTHTPEFFFLGSFYLIDEECHPCLFELDIENPELLEELDNGY
jgi:hypothetical protein